MISEFIFDIFFRVYLIGSMVFYFTGQMQYIPQEMWIQYSAMIFFALSLFVPKKREISNVFLAMILLWGIASTLFIYFDDVSRYTLINLFLGILTIKILAERVDFNFKKTGKILIPFILINLAWMWLQLINKDPIFSSVSPQNMPQVDIVGFMSARFALGILASFSIPFLFSVNPWWCLLAIPLLYFSKSSTTVLAGLLSFITLMWFKNKRLLLILGTLAAIPSFYYIFKIDMPSGEFMKRLNVWYTGTAILKLKPWFGYGLGKWAAMNFVGIQGNGQPEKWQWAHNEFFQYMFEQGMVGIIFIYAYFKDSFKRFVINENGIPIFSLMIALIIVSFFHFPFHVGRFAGFSMYILALLEAHRSENSNGFKSLLRSIDEKAVPLAHPAAA